MYKYKKNITDKSITSPYHKYTWLSQICACLIFHIVNLSAKGQFISEDRSNSHIIPLSKKFNLLLAIFGSYFQQISKKEKVDFLVITQSSLAIEDFARSSFSNIESISSATAP